MKRLDCPLGPIAVVAVAALSGCKAGPSPSVAVEESAPRAEIRGWLSWRGPHQNGTCDETGLPDAVGEENLAWTVDVHGRGTPVIANGRVYAMGYEEVKGDLVEVLMCLDEKTGERLWDHHEADFISDIIYDRYAIASPTVDPETGNIFAMNGTGLLSAFTPDGEMLWQISMMETLGRLTFPNGRTGAPAIDGDLVIVNAISTNWGAEGPPRNRFYAFDKVTGEPRWSSTPVPVVIFWRPLLAVAVTSR